MNLVRFFVLWGALTLAAIPAGAVAGRVTINGSTTVLPIMQHVAEMYMAAHPGVRIELAGGGSGNGIKALLEGQTMIAMSSRELRPGEVARAKARGVALSRLSVAVDALVPIVHPANRVESLSLAQLRDIYAGRITNWRDVGGADARIVVISRDTSSGTYETWSELVMGREKITPSALLQASSGMVAQMVGTHKNAIGYIGLGYVEPSVKSLGLEGQAASVDSALTREWPLARELYIFTSANPADVVKAFITYLIDPAKGQRAVRDMGFVPVR